MNILKIDPDREYTPLQMARLGFIRSRLNRGSYDRALKMIRAGRIKAVSYTYNTKLKYWLVKGSWIIDYLNKYEPGRFKIKKIK